MSFALTFDLKAKTFQHASIQALSLEAADCHWIHCESLDPETIQKLKLPAEFLQLVNEDERRGKVVETAESVLIQLPCLGGVSYEEVTLYIYLTNRFCLTVASKPVAFLSSLVHEMPKNIQYIQTPGFVLFLVFEQIASLYLKLVESLETASDAQELRLYEEHEGSFAEIVALKKQVVQIKRFVFLLRDTIIHCTGHKISVLSEQCRTSLLAQLESIKMVISDLEMTREVLNISTNIIENYLRQKLNATIRFLTVISSIFLPLSVLLKLYELHFSTAELRFAPYEYAIAAVLVLVALFVLRALYRQFKSFW